MLRRGYLSEFSIVVTGNFHLSMRLILSRLAASRQSRIDSARTSSGSQLEGLTMVKAKKKAAKKPAKKAAKKKKR
jgi:hypothetical protein